ncbi:hypothetical protein H257_14831 [Aphanomyces astaci]|uniref:DDE Tnp4 domain-containing protein n=1 Tax=Aphanomyces astaci TaxID=112090 RepID=W4FR74_APHAT|nr:hypothetical protein H257_14831 [Aphanomyces astaci]ETV69461.1 hypothetical protein H257_14831 [Aphanomyces astaci]|eukprot:XP_009841034.1 hypothetical protein H257_14831 [Aphanomyces astaci]
MHISADVFHEREHITLEWDDALRALSTEGGSFRIASSCHKLCALIQPSRESTSRHGVQRAKLATTDAMFVEESKKLATVLGNSGSKARRSAEVIEATIKVVSQEDRQTLRSLAAHNGIPKTTIMRHMPATKKLMARSSHLKPFLTVANKTERLRFAMNFLLPGSKGRHFFDAMYNQVYIDEKWFFLTQVKRTFYVYEDDELAHRAAKSKRFITKVMFLAAVARPRYDPRLRQEFDGKLGIWPFVQRVPAARNTCSTRRELVQSRNSLVLLTVHFLRCCQNSGEEFVTLQKVMETSMEVLGGNNYKLPHLKKDCTIQDLSTFKVHYAASTYNSVHAQLNSQVEKPMDSFSIVTRLQQQVADDVHALDEMGQVCHAAPSQHVEEADDSPTPVIDSFFSQGGNASLSTMTTQSEFKSIWAIVESAMHRCEVLTIVPSDGPIRRSQALLSVKHKLYGLKLEYSVAYPGVPVDMSEHSPGSVADVTMFMHRRHVHQDMLSKTASQMEEGDHDECAEEYPDSWSILVHMGYQRIQYQVRSMQAKTSRRPLTARELEPNSRVSSDRVMVENYFGRICSLWKIMRETYKWNKPRFDRISRLCVN